MAWILLLVSLAILGGVYYSYIVPSRRVWDILEDMSEGRIPSTFVRCGAEPIQRAIACAEGLNRRLVESERRLSKEELNLHAIVRSMTEGVFVVNMQQSVLLANVPALTMFGWGENEVKGRTLQEISRQHELFLACSEALARGCPIVKEIELIRSMATAERPQVIRVSVTPVRNDAGQWLGAAVVCHDITEQRTLEAMRRNFVANTSHELRTPLAVFQGYLETLMDAETPTPEETKSVLQVLHRNALRLNRLVEDLLTLSRLESNAFPLHISVVPVAEFLQRVQADFMKDLRRTGCRIELAVASGLPSVPMDEHRIEQVLFNLLDNAVMYSPEGSLVRITVCPRGEAEVEFCVEDQGIGIPPKDLPHIFERFYRVDKSRSRSKGGTGLGLSIVKHIIQAHGGRVWADSSVNHGTKIWFCLPLLPVEA
jgi:two-component system phosphate regulon sensor histidine kinase PhoR